MKCDNKRTFHGNYYYFILFVLLNSSFLGCASNQSIRSSPLTTEGELDEGIARPSEDKDHIGLIFKWYRSFVNELPKRIYPLPFHIPSHPEGKLLTIAELKADTSIYFSSTITEIKKLGIDIDTLELNMKSQKGAILFWNPFKLKNIELISNRSMASFLLERYMAPIADQFWLALLNFYVKILGKFIDKKELNVYLDLKSIYSLSNGMAKHIATELPFLAVSNQLKKPKSTLKAEVSIFKELAIQQNTTALVYYRWYKDAAKNVSLPKSMQNFINNKFKYLKKHLKPDHKRILENCELVFETPKIELQTINREDLEPILFTKTAGRKIYVSPSLIRAVFMQSFVAPQDLLALTMICYNNSDSLRDKKFLKIFTRTFDFTVLEEFTNSFLFPFAHEMAHIYLANDHKSKDNIEELCDCYALNHIWSIKKEKTSTGYFESILVQAFEENTEELWDSSNNNEVKNKLKSRLDLLKERLERLKKDSAVVESCEIN